MKSIISILENDSSLNGLIGSNKVFTGFVPQEVQSPHITVKYSIEDPHNSGTGQNLDELKARIFIESEKEYTDGAVIGAFEIGEAVRSALHGFKGTSEGQVINVNFQDSDTQRITNPNSPCIEIEQIYQVFMIANFIPSEISGQPIVAFLLNQTAYDALMPNASYYYLIDNDIP